MNSISDCGVRIRRGPFVSSATDEINVALGGILVETTGSVATASNAPVTVSLFINGQLVASSAFTYSKSEQMLNFDQPNAVNAWVNSYSGRYDTMDAELTGLRVVSAVGQNSITVTEKIGPFSMSTASTSWSRSAPSVDDTAN